MSQVLVTKTFYNPNFLVQKSVQGENVITDPLILLVCIIMKGEVSNNVYKIYPINSCIFGHFRSSVGPRLTTQTAPRSSQPKIGVVNSKFKSVQDSLFDQTLNLIDMTIIF